MPYLYLDFLDPLKRLFKSIFDTVLSPVISSVAQILINMTGSLLTDVFSSLLLRFFVTLLKLVDFLESIFNIFSGVSPVKYKGETTYLLDLFFNMEPLQKAFLMITLLASGIALIFTMYATAKSISDMVLENKNPISTVLKRSFKSMITFLMVPLLCLFMLQFSTSLLKQLNTVFAYTLSGNKNSTMGDVLFITASGEAANSREVLSKFATGQRYENLDSIKNNFDIKKINYIVAYLGTGIVILIMLGAILLFIRRILEILLLYTAAPFFVSAMPLDDGVMFGKWRDLFVAKVLSGFGAIISMKIYFLIAPALTNGDITLSLNASLNRCMQLFIVIGGAWAVYKGQHMILQILNPDAAAAAQQSTGALVAFAAGAALGAGRLAGNVAGGLINGSGKLGGKTGNDLGGKLGGSLGGGTGQGRDSTDNQAFTGH